MKLGSARGSIVVAVPERDYASFHEEGGLTTAPPPTLTTLTTVDFVDLVLRELDAIARREALAVLPAAAAAARDFERQMAAIEAGTGDDWEATAAKALALGMDVRREGS